MKKFILSFVILLVIAFIVYVTISFFGTPWKKTQVAKELEEYVEKKYDIDVTLKEKFYNFKGSSYGAEFTLENSAETTFIAEKYRSGNVSDYYAEGVWVTEVETDVLPILEKSFPSFTVKSSSVNPVYGMGDELVKDKNIPSYKDVTTGVDISIRFKEEWTDETEETLLREGYEFISALQRSDVKNLGIRLYIDKEIDEQRTKSFGISMDGKQFNGIKSEDHLKQTIITF